MQRTITIAKVKGFSLIEMMIVVVIIGILASIAYPSYLAYVDRGRRAEGVAALVDLASRQERFYTANLAYSANAGLLGAVQTEGGWYTLAAVLTAGGGYRLTATPTGWVDAGCNVLSLDNTGARGENGSLTVRECWGN